MSCEIKKYPENAERMVQRPVKERNITSHEKRNSLCKTAIKDDYF
jgi:hypothetical protein